MSFFIKKLCHTAGRIARLAKEFLDKRYNHAELGPAKERNALIEKGLDPDDIDYEGTELEKEVSNRDTLRKQWEEIWDICRKDSSGQLPGKTILFAMTQDHALRLQDAFCEMYPQFPDLAKVITHKSEYRGTLVDAFKKKDEPRIAISVDMLDTGIDVPEIVNLVFAKPVFSYVKFWQMIGCGTRLRPNLFGPGKDKTHFQIFDHWANFDYFDFHYQHVEPSVSKSLMQLVLEARVDLAQAALQAAQPEANVDIGGARVTNLVVTFGDLHVFSIWSLLEEPALLIGMDLLGTVPRFVVDYPRREFQFKPAGSKQQTIRRCSGTECRTRS